MGESSIQTSWLKGHDKGREEGKLAVARRLIESGMSEEKAAEIAGVNVKLLRYG